LPPPSLPPAPIADPPDESGSLVLHFGTAVGLAAAAALAASLPAALRIATVSGQDTTEKAWTGLAAAALVPMIGTVVVLRGAREGLRAFGGPGAELRAYGVGLWAASLLVTLTFFGSVLRATTHQHALAGVTFALGGLAVAIGSALVCVRVVAILKGASQALQGGIALALAMLVFASLGLIGMRFLNAASRDPASSPAAGMVVDVLAFGLAGLFAARRSLASRRALALIGPPVAVAILALGLSALRDAPLRAAIDERAPAFAPVVDEVPSP
jgi:hypothetical protein